MVIDRVMKIFAFLVVLMGLAAGGVYYFYLAPDAGGLEAVHPVTGPAVQAVYATGTVEPSVMMPIAPRSAARLMTLLADEGQHVTKGQVLAQLEDSDLQKQLEEEQAKADFAQKDFNRKAELVKRGVISRETADQVKANLDAAKAAVARVKAQLGFLQLTAPENGVVIRRDGEVGALIAANTPVFWLSCCAPMRIAVEVDEEDIALVKPGQKVVIRADAFPGRVFEGTVSAITPKGDSVSRSYRVRIGLPVDTALMTGMTAESNIIIRETRDALLVPTGAVQDEEVWIVENGKAQRRAVETGAKATDFVEIIRGLGTGDIVLVNPSEDLREGDSVSYSLIAPNNGKAP